MIRDHVWRPAHKIRKRRTGQRGGIRIRPGMCVYGGTCDRPERAHLTVAAYRARRGA